MLEKLVWEKKMRNSIISWKYLLAACLIAGPAVSETTVKIAGWGAKSGPLRSFGVNSQAIIDAAITQVNENGGVTLADGTKAMMAVD